MRNSRPFQEVSLHVTGSQLFKHRFPERHPLDEDVPRVSLWACNLTDLSHVYNLYFVAYVGSIHVYEPRFPTQSLPCEPGLIVDTESLSPEIVEDSVQGSRRRINRLIVQQLGNEEVLAVVRDDGDVEAYYTRQIYHAIERRTHIDNTLGTSAVDVKPWFHRNVGNSAWGLSIHSKARMMAVSSNNHEVTVFTFALIEDEPDDDTPSVDPPTSVADDDVYHSREKRVPPSDRRKNDVRIIANGDANIPDIAFCNTGHDPQGRWLLTADVAGLVRTYDVHALSCSLLARTTMRPSTQLTRNWDPKNAAWGVMFLDPLSFRATNTIAEALSLRSEEENIDKRLAMWDLSRTVDQVKGVREPLRNVRQPVDVVDGNYADPLGISNTFRQLPSDLPGSRSATSHSDSDDSEGEDEDMDDGDESEEDSEDESTDPGNPNNTRQTSIARLDAEMRKRQLDRDKRPQITFGGQTAFCEDNPCPILQLSVKNMYMFQPSPNNDALEHLPVHTFAKLFDQPLHGSTQLSRHNIDRMNMYAQIPSLGVVVIATQRGRAAVVSLTQTVTELPDHGYQNDGPGFGSERPVLRRLYGCRVDHVLPLASQEAAGYRPRCGLHGIAVGPVQGTEELDDDLKRWRVLLYYQDHTLLSYEIGRPKDEGVGIVDIIM